MIYENMTWVDLVHKYFPEATEEQVNFILWEKTAYPMSSVETVEKQLQEYKQEVEEYRKSK